MLLSPFVTALRTLTIIPVPSKDTERFHRALLFFPLVGGVLGLFHLLIFRLLSLSTELIPLSGVILCITNYLLSGALHLDGFADTADAFGTVRSREKTLQILKDCHLGTYGVASVVFLILWRVTLYQSLAEESKLIWLVPCLAFSRIIQGFLLCTLPYARDKSGKAFIFCGKPVYAIFLFLEMIVIGILVYFYSDLKSLIPLMVGLLFITPAICLYLYRVKGITGDGVGACSELFELGFLTATMVIL